MDNSEIIAAIKRSVRRAASARNNIPVVFLKDSDKEPAEVGHGYHYCTKGGTIIDHPSAYSRSGWSNMVYVGSTIRVEVGVKWIKENFARKTYGALLWALFADEI